MGILRYLVTIAMGMNLSVVDVVRKNDLMDQTINWNDPEKKKQIIHDWILDSLKKNRDVILDVGDEKKCLEFINNQIEINKYDYLYNDIEYVKNLFLNVIHPQGEKVDPNEQLVPLINYIKSCDDIEDLRYQLKYILKNLYDAELKLGLEHRPNPFKYYSAVGDVREIVLDV